MNAPFRHTIAQAEPATPFERGMGAGYMQAGYCAAGHAITALGSAINSMTVGARHGRRLEDGDALADRLRAELARLDALLTEQRRQDALDASLRAGRGA